MFVCFSDLKIVHIHFPKNSKNEVNHRRLFKNHHDPNTHTVEISKCYYHFNYTYPIFALNSYMHFSFYKIGVITYILFTTFAF